MKICLVGPPGAGKGTQADLLVEYYRANTNLMHISTGDVLRSVAAQPTVEGLALKNLLKDGHLAPSPLVVRLLGEYLSDPKYQSGYILDGSPRTAAEFLQWIHDFPSLKPELVIRINVPDEDVVVRLSQRRICVSENQIWSGALDQCPNCNEPLVRREDDHPDAIRMRLQHFHIQQAEIQKECQNLGIWQEIDGSGSQLETRAKLIKVIDSTF